MKRAKIFISTIMAVLIMTAAHAIAESEHTGTVLETASGGGYTYLEVNENGKRFWIAGPETSVSKGAKISFSEQIWMSNFTSKALNRTFDKILFVSGVYVDPSKTNSPARTPDKRSESAEAAKTYTIEEIYSRKSELKGQLIKVRGNVVKVSENIMGRTWVHIEDGTGSKGSNKLVFRSENDSAAVGSVVTAQGVLETDKDFGFGYFYSVIIEGSTFSE